MARPQLEDGYVRVANELLEAISRCNDFQPRMRILIWVIRHTYGWNCKMRSANMRQIARETGLPRRTVHRVIHELREHNIITVWSLKHGRHKFNIGIQKDHEKWPRHVTQVTTSFAQLGHSNFNDCNRQGAIPQSKHVTTLSHLAEPTCDKGDRLTCDKVDRFATPIAFNRNNFQTPKDILLKDKESSSSSRDDSREKRQNFRDSVIAMFNNILPEISTPPVWTERIQDEFARATEVLPNVSAWENYCHLVRRSEYLMGKTDKRSLPAEFAFLMRPQVIDGVLSGRYGCNRQQIDNDDPVWQAFKRKGKTREEYEAWRLKRHKTPKPLEVESG